jgi:hypothetical protein
MAKLSYKVSYYALYVCFALIIIVFGAFYTIGWNDSFTEDGNYNIPLLTDLVLYFMYALVLVGIILTVWGVINSIKCGGSGSEGGVNDKLVSGIAIGSLIVSLVVGLVCGLGEEDFVAMDGTVTTAGWVTVVDVFITSIYILTAVAIVGVIVNLSGMLKK